VDLLIDEISEAAYKAIEQAAGEAAKAATLESLERVAVALHEATKQQAEAQPWQFEAEANFKAITEAKRARVKNVIITGLACLLGGLALGISGTILMRN
jgi:hypothetical protein